MKILAKPQKYPDSGRERPGDDAGSMFVFACDPKLLGQTKRQELAHSQEKEEPFGCYLMERNGCKRNNRLVN